MGAGLRSGRWLGLLPAHCAPVGKGKCASQPLPEPEAPHCTRAPAGSTFRASPSLSSAAGAPSATRCPGRSPSGPLPQHSTRRWQRGRRGSSAVAARRATSSMTAAATDTTTFSLFFPDWFVVPCPAVFSSGGRLPKDSAHLRSFCQVFTITARHWAVQGVRRRQWAAALHGRCECAPALGGGG